MRVVLNPIACVAHLRLSDHCKIDGTNFSAVCTVGVGDSKPTIRRPLEAMRILRFSVAFIGGVVLFLLGAVGDVLVQTDRQCGWMGYFCGPRTAIENRNSDHVSPRALRLVGLWLRAKTDPCAGGIELKNPIAAWCSEPIKGDGPVVFLTPASSGLRALCRSAWAAGSVAPKSKFPPDALWRVREGVSASFGS
jgi:hypothetical protein